MVASRLRPFAYLLSWHCRTPFFTHLRGLLFLSSKMEIPIAQARYAAPREFGSTLPSICNDDHFRPFESASRSNTFHDALSPASASRPMSIQSRQSHIDAPPPLPPPRYVPIAGPIDPQYQFKDQYSRDRNVDSPSGDSFDMSFGRRPFSSSRHDDEGYQSLDSSRYVHRLATQAPRPLGYSPRSQRSGRDPPLPTPPILSMQ